MTIVGTVNLADAALGHASQMYTKNVAAFILHLVKGGALLDLEDEVIRETLLTRDGQVVHPQIRE